MYSKSLVQIQKVILLIIEWLNEIIIDSAIVQQLKFSVFLKYLSREPWSQMSKSPKKTEKEIINHDIDIYQEKPESADIEILCGRAAKLAYLSARDLNALFYDVTESLTEDSSICGQPYSTLETVGPLLQSRDHRTISLMWTIRFHSWD